MALAGAIGPISSACIVIPWASCLRRIRDAARWSFDPSQDVWGLRELGYTVELSAWSRRNTLGKPLSTLLRAGLFPLGLVILISGLP